MYGNVSKYKPNYDFLGWSDTYSSNSTLLVDYNNQSDTSRWSNLSLNNNVYTYYYYAICSIHEWNVNFYNGETLIETVTVPNGNVTTGPNNTPYKDDTNIPCPEG